MPVVDVEAKLALTEFLLSSIDMQASARRALDWLASHTGVEQAMVAVHDQLTGQVLLVAEYGVSSAAVVDFVLSREDDAHPLIRALGDAASRPTSNPRRRPFTRRSTAPFHAIPLRGEDDDRADGLLHRRCANGRSSIPRSPGSPGSSAARSRVCVSRSYAGRNTVRPGADAALQHHQRRHRPDSADRHRRQADHRELARGEAVRRARGGERRLAACRRPEQHALLGGALDQRGGAYRARAAGAAARRSDRRVGPPVRAPQLAGQGRTAGHLRRVDSAQRHRPRPRQGRDRGKLSHAADGPGGSPR